MGHWLWLLIGVALGLWVVPMFLGSKSRSGG